jgi:hypothetical protein
VLVDELRKAIPDKQDGEAVERRDEALKLHAIHEEYSAASFGRAISCRCGEARAVE